MRLPVVSDDNICGGGVALPLQLHLRHNIVFLIIGLSLLSTIEIVTLGWQSDLPAATSRIIFQTIRCKLRVLVHIRRIMNLREVSMRLNGRHVSLHAMIAGDHGASTDRLSILAELLGIFVYQLVLGGIKLIALVVSLGYGDFQVLILQAAISDFEVEESTIVLELHLLLL